jgi:3-oxoacyl-[acyl-carrier-protein] synthase III
MRIAGQIVITGTSVWLPDGRESAADAIASSKLDEDTADDLGYHELSVSTGQTPPEMAVLAAESALDSAGVSGADVGILVHAYSYYQGHDFFSPAHFIADRLGARNANPFCVAQMSNGGATSVQLAVAQLLADPHISTALVSTADRFCEPGFDRWCGDYGVAFGDGATAMVLRRASDTRSTDLALLAMNSVAAPEFEAMLHAGDPFSLAPREHARSVNTRRNKKAFLEANGSEGFMKAQREKLRDVIERSLAESGIAPDDRTLRYVLLPRLAQIVLEDSYLSTLAEITTATPIDFGAHTGHLGSGDLLANTAALVDDEMLAPGETAIALSAGAGFSWSCVVMTRTGES